MFDSSDTFGSVQRKFKDIFGVHNDRLFSSGELVGQLNRFANRVSKMIRKGQLEQIEKGLAIMFAWAMAVANKLHIDVAEELFLRFPDCCPYCGKKPCDCSKGKPSGTLALTQPLDWSSKTVGDAQQMLRDIYPKNVLQVSIAHLIEEISELDEAIVNHNKNPTQTMFREIVTELVDVFANLFAVANCANRDLLGIVDDHFKDGCSNCHQCPCSCGWDAVAGTRA